MTERVFHTNGKHKSLTSSVQQNEGGRGSVSTHCVHTKEEGEIFNLKKTLCDSMGANWYGLAMINRITKKYIN